MYREFGNVSIKRETYGKLPSLPYFSIKNKVLGKKYELSILFATPQNAQKLNHLYRKKSYTPNILSFSLNKSSGELVLCLGTIRSQAKSFEMSYQDFLSYLYIHGLLHLKGIEHGSTMEREENAIFKKFFGDDLPHGTNHTHRHRHRNISHSRRHRRV